MNKAEYTNDVLLDSGRWYRAVTGDGLSFDFRAMPKPSKSVISVKNGGVYDYWPYKYKFKANDFGSIVYEDGDDSLIRLTKMRSKDEVRDAIAGFPDEFPLLYKEGLIVQMGPIGMPFVPFELVSDVLGKKSQDFIDRFQDLMQGHTVSSNGYYPHDIEYALLQIEYEESIRFQ